MKHLATTQQRLVAKVIDWAFGIFPMLAFLTSFELIVKEEVPTIVIIPSVIPAIGLLLIAIMILQWALIAFQGQSIGKILIRIRIVDEKTKKVGTIWQNLVLRTLINLLMLGNLVYFLLDGLLIFRKERRCIHDMIAKTIVIKT